MTPSSQSDGAWPEIGSVWRNNHTDKSATVLDVLRVERPTPHSLAQDPRDGRLIFGDWHPVETVIVRFTDGAPPGYDDEKNGGWSLSQWLLHWTPDIGGSGGES
jgi:hypothetical protein